MTLSGEVIVADDIRQELNGKLVLVGVYTNDISIPWEPYYAPLAFLFCIEGPHPAARQTR